MQIGFVRFSPLVTPRIPARGAHFSHGVDLAFLSVVSVHCTNRRLPTE